MLVAQITILHALLLSVSANDYNETDELGAAAALFAGDVETAVQDDRIVWPESPIYSESGNFVLFSDVKWADPESGLACGMLWKFDVATEELSELLKCSGLVGPVGFDAVDGLPGDIANLSEAGSNGLSWGWDDGTLLLNQHGWNRMVLLSLTDIDAVNATIDASLVTIVVDSYNGSALNSPNDVDLTGDGELIFSDPPFGHQYTDDANAFYSSFDRMTQSETAVYRVSAVGAEPEKLIGFGAPPTDGRYGPNGVGVNEANGDLGVAVIDLVDARVHIYARNADGSYATEPKQILYQNKSYEGMPVALVDGLTFDAELGVLFVNGPAGVYIYEAPEDAEGDYEYMGFIRLNELCSNNGVGGGYLWIVCANEGLLRVPLAVSDEDESGVSMHALSMFALGASYLALALSA